MTSINVLKEFLPDGVDPVVVSTFPDRCKSALECGKVCGIAAVAELVERFGWLDGGNKDAELLVTPEWTSPVVAIVDTVGAISECAKGNLCAGLQNPPLRINEIL
jgi:hypothetical protein